MSRAWIAFYPGDYDKDTQHLSTLEHGAYFLLLKHCWIHGSIPLEQDKRANIARMSTREWTKAASTINAFFEDDGTQKRATKEIEKAEIIYAKRSMAGTKGGFASGISRAIKQGRNSKYEANSNQTFKQTAKQTMKQKVSSAEAIHNRDIITSTVDEDTGGENGSSLATALPAGALRELPNCESNKITKLSLSAEALEKMRNLR